MRKKERSHVGKILEMTKDRCPERLRRRIWPSKMEEQQKQKKLQESKAPGLRYEITKEEWRQGKRITGDSVVGIYRGK